MSDNFKIFLYVLGSGLFVGSIMIIEKDLDIHNCHNIAKEFRGTGTLYGKQCVITAHTGHKMPVEI